MFKLLYFFIFIFCLERLLQTLKHRSILYSHLPPFHMQVGLNPIGDDGVEALLKAVKINKSLKLFGLEVHNLL